MSTLFSPEKVESAVSWVNEQIDKKAPFQLQGNGSHGIKKNKQILSSQKLKQLVFFDENDQVAGVQAGILFKDFQTILKSKNYYLPVNPWYGNTTLGGLLAMNNFGSHRLERGGIRDFIIGMEYVNGFGKLVKGGGKVVKNVTGYDVPKMMLGSRGGLGFITSANFKLTPVPENPISLCGKFNDTQWCFFIKKLHETGLPLEWLQVMNKGKDWEVGIGISGNTQRIARMESEIEKIFNTTLTSISGSAKESDWNVGKNMFSGFLSTLKSSLAHQIEHLHIHAIFPTAPLLNKSLYNGLLKWDLSIVAHPIGGDIHIFF